MDVISKNLPNEAKYLQLIKNTKKPIKQEWTSIPHNLKDKANQLLKQGYGIGFLLGDGYVGVDCDSIELELAVEQLIKTPTYTQKSAGRGMKHFIFKCNFDKNLGLKHNNQEVGEILCSGRQIILAPTKIQDKQYTILNDIPPAEITKEELLSVILQFESKITQKSVTETKKLYEKADIDDLSITSIISTTGMQQDSRGQYFGENTWHGSTTGHNFYINPQKNLAYCFRCDCAISPAKAIALNEGIISNCSDELRGEDFIKTLEVAKTKYNLKDKKELSEKEKQDTPLNFWTIQDYENYKPPKNYIIENLLFPSEIAMNYGQTSSFKSFYNLYQAVCISAGRKFLNKFRTKKQAVGILSAENSIAVDKDRIKKIMRGLRIRKRNIPLYILPRSDCFDILNLKFKAKLIKSIQKKNIKLLFLDTINPLTPEIDDNKARDVTRTFNEFLKLLADVYGVSVVFLHHTDKQGKAFLGSTKWKANCDCVTRIERNGLKESFSLYNEKNRTGETNTLKINIMFGEKDICFSLVEETAPEIFSKNKKMTQAEFFDLKLKELCEKDMERAKIFEIFEENGIKFSRASLDRAIKIWRIK